MPLPRSHSVAGTEVCRGDTAPRFLSIGPLGVVKMVSAVLGGQEPVLISAGEALLAPMLGNFVQPSPYHVIDRSDPCYLVEAGDADPYRLHQ